MKKNTSAIIAGLILILLGLLIAAKAFNFIEFSIFFDGWWTLFLIIPCGVCLFNKDSNRTACLTGLIIGIFLLLCAQDIIRWSMIVPLGIAALLLIVGIKMIFNKNDKSSPNNPYNSANTQNNTSASQNTSDSTGYNTNYSFQNEYGKVTVDVPYRECSDDAQQSSDSSENTSNQQSSENSSSSQSSTDSYSYDDYNFNKKPYSCSAIFGGREINFDNEFFTGASLSAVFGAVELDLRRAKLQKHTIINCNAIFGGIDIAIPSYAKVIVNGTPILGGVDCKAKAAPPNADDASPVITINVSCILGGIDIK